MAMGLGMGEWAVRKRELHWAKKLCTRDTAAMVQLTAAQPDVSLETLSLAKYALYNVVR